jgi:hypothetical protein
MKKVAAITLLLLAGACHKDGQKDGEKPPRNPGYVGVLDDLGIPHRTLSEKMRQPDPAGWPKDGAANGIKVQRLTGAQIGLPRAEAPYAKFTTMDAIKQIDLARTATGVFIVDTDYVPRDLPEIMRMKGLTAAKDGRLTDANGEAVALLIQGETYLAQGPSGRQTSLLDKVSDLLIPPAKAASPFPWRCFSFSPWAIYHGGFHRWYEAGTSIGAYGADGAGQCSGASPRTNIDFLQARAAVGFPGNQNFCFTCTTQSAYDTWDVGYFWPAHGIPTTTHSGVWADGRFSFSRTAHLSW